MTSYALAIRRTASDGAPLVALEVLAREAGLHPELVRRLIVLGALEAHGGTTGAPLFHRDAAARLARLVRLRRDLGLDYAGAMLACDLLARIEALEHRLAGLEPDTGGDERMDLNRLTEKTQQALQDAQTIALRHGNTEVDVEHLLLALVDQRDGLIGRLLERAGVDVGAMRDALERHLERLPRVGGPGASGQVHVSQTLHEVLDAAAREADSESPRDRSAI